MTENNVKKDEISIFHFKMLVQSYPLSVQDLYLNSTTLSYVVDIKFAPPPKKKS